MNPNHVAAQNISAPLFFVQLLRRYPFEDIVRDLGHETASGSAGNLANQASAQGTISPSLAHALPVAIEVGANLPGTATSIHAMPASGGQMTFSAANLTQAFGGFGSPIPGTPIASGLPWLDQNVSPTAIPTPPSAMANPYVPPVAAPPMDLHHIYDLGSEQAPERVQSLRAAEDFLIKDAGLDDFVDDRSPSAFTGLVNFAAVIAIVVGLGALSYFGMELYPELQTFPWQERVTTLVSEFRGRSAAFFGPLPTTDEANPPSTSLVDKPEPVTIVGHEKSAPEATATREPVPPARVAIAPDPGVMRR